MDSRLTTEPDQFDHSTEERAKHLAGLVLAFIGAAVISPAPLCTKLAAKAGATPWEVVGWNYLFGFLVLTFKSVLTAAGEVCCCNAAADGKDEHIEQHSNQRTKEANWKSCLWLMAGMLFLSMCNISITIAMQYATALNVLVISALAPVWAGIMSAVVNKCHGMNSNFDQASQLRIVFVAVGMAVLSIGINNVGDEEDTRLQVAVGDASNGVPAGSNWLWKEYLEAVSSNGHIAGAFLALSYSTLLALYLTLSRFEDHERKRMCVSATSSGFLFTAATGITLTMLADDNTRGFPFSAMPKNTVAMGWCALSGFCSVTGLQLWKRATIFISSTEVGMVANIEMLLAPIWCWIVLSEIPNAWTIAGGTIIVISMCTFDLYMVQAMEKAEHRNTVILKPGDTPVKRHSARQPGRDRSTEGERMPSQERPRRVVRI